MPLSTIKIKALNHQNPRLNHVLRLAIDHDWIIYLAIMVPIDKKMAITKEWLAFLFDLLTLITFLLLRILL
jgi:hypothetical protein